jgi:hypothetical protein
MGLRIEALGGGMARTRRPVSYVQLLTRAGVPGAFRIGQPLAWVAGEHGSMRFNPKGVHQMSTPLEVGISDHPE